MLKDDIMSLPALRPDAMKEAVIELLRKYGIEELTLDRGISAETNKGAHHDSPC